MNRSGAAPCQCSSPGSKNTRSPGRMTSIDPPRRWHRPVPSVTSGTVYLDAVAAPFGPSRPQALSVHSMAFLGISVLCETS